MSISFGVTELGPLLEREGPWFLTGQLWVDATEVRLFSKSGDASVRVADPEAHAALLAAIAPARDHLEEAVLQGFLRKAGEEPEVHGVYWVSLGVSPKVRRIDVRPVPPEHDYER